MYTSVTIHLGNEIIREFEETLESQIESIKYINAVQLDRYCIAEQYHIDLFVCIK